MPMQTILATMTMMIMTSFGDDAAADGDDRRRLCCSS